MKKKLAEIINIIFGFRKFLLMLFVMLIAVIFRVKELVNGAEMVDLIKTCAIAFMAANGVEHVVGAAQTHMTQKAALHEAGPADTDPSNDEETIGDPEPKD